MSDYIKREDALRAFNGRCSTVDADDILRHLHKSIDVIKNVPSADVVEVVRCKDCKHKPNGYTDDDVLRYPNFPHEENNPCPCQVYEDKWYSWIPNDDFYCSYGERADK